jgi:ABC-type nitrate/sulfonate/bicarbonate transport system permease component
VLWGLGWSTVVAAEMLGVDSGLQHRLLDFRTWCSIRGVSSR